VNHPAHPATPEVVRPALRIPAHARDQVCLACDVAARQLTIIERRAPWHEDLGLTRLPTARPRYTRASRTWSLYWRDRNLRFHQQMTIMPSGGPQEASRITHVGRHVVADGLARP
jgi:hypothetical protein